MPCVRETGDTLPSAGDAFGAALAKVVTLYFAENPFGLAVILSAHYRGTTLRKVE